MKRIFLLLLCMSFLAGSTVFAEAKAATPLDSKTFTGMMGEKTDKKGDPDNFEFKDGMFHSTACDQYGYTAAKYQSTDKSGTTNFTATTKNNSGDTIAWNGTVKGDKIMGTAVRHSGKEKHEMWFRGELKKGNG